MSFLLPFLFLFPLFMLAVMVHEVSHGLVALALGDSTARDAGRLTLNPLRHIDPVGTLALPLLLLSMHLPAFGWAKPVPINVLNLRRPKRDMLWVGAAGPAANFLFAAAGAGLLSVFGGALPALAAELARYLIQINLVLGTFNLLPIPPLDGSRVLTSLLPLPLARLMLSMERWGFLFVFALLYLGVLDKLIWPAVEFLARMLRL